MTAIINSSPLPKRAKLTIFSNTVAAVSLAFILAACTQQSATGAKAVPEVPGPAGKLLATVNGHPITEYDVRLKLKIKDPEVEILPGSINAALDELIMDELKYQEAIRLGLDKDPEYQRKNANLMADINYFRRGEMGNLFYREQVVAKAVVSDEEAKKFFDENKQMIQTELHVWQIFSRDTEDMEKVLDKIKSGTSFLDVAKARFPELPKGSVPWDLGYLHWNQIPESWHEEISRMKKGEVSGIIKGVRGRAWVIRLIDKRINPEINFENQKKLIMHVLRSKKMEELAATVPGELRKKAKIAYQGK